MVQNVNIGFMTAQQVIDYCNAIRYHLKATIIKKHIGPLND